MIPAIAYLAEFALTRAIPFVAGAAARAIPIVFQSALTLVRVAGMVANAARIAITALASGAKRLVSAAASAGRTMKRLSDNVTRHSEEARLHKLQRTFRDLRRTRLLIGIPQEHDTRAGEPIGNAAIGAINEFGSPSQNIPPRPHLVPGVRAVRDEMTKAARSIVLRAVKGANPRLEETLHAVGLVAVSSVRNKITQVIPPPLSPVTIGKRQARGHKGETPLIDTGKYLAAISYVIRKL